MVVSMRPMTPLQAVRATQVTTRFSATHGAPVHIGDPEAIGIRDIQDPTFGAGVDVFDSDGFRIPDVHGGRHVWLRIA